MAAGIADHLYSSLELMRLCPGRDEIISPYDPLTTKFSLFKRIVRSGCGLVR